MSSNLGQFGSQSTSTKLKTNTISPNVNGVVGKVGLELKKELKKKRKKKKQLFANEKVNRTRSFSLKENSLYIWVFEFCH